jgi:putative phosphoesterase
MRIIGLVSDTHDGLHPNALTALRGVELILHAGDIGPPEVLRALGTLAPVRGVAGDRDRAGRADLAASIDELFDQVRVVVTHGQQFSPPTPPRLVSSFMHADVIVFGHTREPLLTRAARRIIVNPGSAGVQRGPAPPSVGRLYIQGRQADAQLIPLDPDDVLLVDGPLEAPNEL